ncbi:hypothetical protein GGX14DRAFT_389359 [Mycena pura]|uniref:MYND-type domain-containing protein n=1 Tax=Mycena pura TaxID=153505 RepID=A0AAD6YH33_9AGAR|nr:hypothetical protein GGX14DRAFT_389359 [Mycena pura]
MYAANGRRASSGRYQQDMERLNKLKKLDPTLKNKANSILTADSAEAVQMLSDFLEHDERAYLANEKAPLSPIHIPLIFHALDESRIPGQGSNVPQNVKLHRLAMSWCALQDLAVVDVSRTESGSVVAELWKSAHKWIHYWYHAPPQPVDFTRLVVFAMIIARFGSHKDLYPIVYLTTTYPTTNCWRIITMAWPHIYSENYMFRQRVAHCFQEIFASGDICKPYDEQEVTAMIRGAGREREFAELMAGDLEIVGGEAMANQCKPLRWLASATFISRVLMSVSRTSKLVEYLIRRGVFQIIHEQVRFIATEHALSDRALTICTLVAKHPDMSAHMHLALRQGYLHIPLMLLTLNPYAAVVSYGRLLLGPLLFASATRFKVAKALVRISTEVGTLAITAAPALQGMRHTMAHFEVLRLHRAGIYVDYRRRRREELRMCADSECCAIGAKDTFKRCTGCLSRYYCSQTCQANDWTKRHRALCFILLAERTDEQTDTNASGNPPRERNFMRKLLDFDFNRLREHVWERQRSFMREKPGELFVTNYDFTSGLADVSVVDAASYRSGLSTSH